MKYKSLAILSLVVIASMAISACSTDTGDLAKDARGRATNQVLSEAASVLGKVAVSTLTYVAQQEMTGGKVDFGSAATQGLYANAPSILNSGQIERIVSAYSGNKLPNTASAAAAAFDGSSSPPAIKANAIAAVISTAAGAPPGL